MPPVSVLEVTRSMLLDVGVGGGNSRARSARAAAGRGKSSRAASVTCLKLRAIVCDKRRLEYFRRCEAINPLSLPTTQHQEENTTTATMPPLRTSRNRKPPPEGFDDIEDTLLEFANKMKDAENASHEGKKKHEMLWPGFQITHQRTYALG